MPNRRIWQRHLGHLTSKLWYHLVVSVYLWMLRLHASVVQIVRSFLYTVDEVKLLLTTRTLLSSFPGLLADIRQSYNLFIIWQNDQVTSDESPFPSEYEVDTD